MPGKISSKQQEILDYIKENILQKGYPPSVREICEAVRLKSTSSVHSHLETLEKNGYTHITREETVELEPATETRKAKTKVVKYHTLTEAGLAYDPIAEEQAKLAAKQAEKERKAAEKAAAKAAKEAEAEF